MTEATENFKVYPFPLLIKAASNQCNLRCAHCFYHPENPHVARGQRMSLPTLKLLTRSYLAQPMSRHRFIWQGGEPCLMGLDFYKQAVQLQKKYACDSEVENSLQTNGTLITPEFARFLSRHDFLVGLSIDGPQKLHDTYRFFKPGQGSYAAVRKALRLLQGSKVQVNALTLLTTANVAQVTDIFLMLAEQGLYVQQYIPCVEFSPSAEPLPFTLSASAWGEALCALFDIWWSTGQKVTVRYFEDLLYTMLTGQHGSCHMARQCGAYVVVEADGSVYPCDFFVGDKWRMGTIQTGWDALLHSKVYQDFSLQKAQQHVACGQCPYLELCQGDCQKHRLPCPQQETGQVSSPALSHLCAGYKMFFAHALPRLREAVCYLKQL